MLIDRPIEKEALDKAFKIHSSESDRRGNILAKSKKWTFGFLYGINPIVAQMIENQEIATWLP